MKKIIKLIVNVLALAMLSVACLGLFACKDEKISIEVTLEIYNASEHEYYEDTTLTIELHSEFAPQTVEAIVKYVNEGYYNDVIFYGMDNNKIMVGDLKMDGDGNIVQNALKPTLKPEYENNGMISGSNLSAVEGSIGLWRTWATNQDYDKSLGNDTGRATWFMPTTEIISYKANFCIFATIDLDDETNATTLSNLKSAVNGAEDYYVYYTGEYNNDDSVLNNGLTFNCSEEEPEDGVAFEPEKEQYVCYKQKKIQVPKGSGNTCGAKIVSARVI